MSEPKKTEASYPTIRRLPIYLNLLRGAEREGKMHISSTYIADRLGVEAIQVRKDLAVTGITGQPGVGFKLDELSKAIEDFLGWNNTTDAFIIGAGNLGSALAGYEGFKNYGLNILALFDTDEKKINQKVGEKSIFHLNKLPDLVERMHVRIGILTVPESSAQQCTDFIVDSGIESIWNFTAVKLNVPEHIIVETVDLAASLAVLSSKLNHKIRRDKGGKKLNYDKAENPD